jgi:hypothetical protein
MSDQSCKSKLDDENFKHDGRLALCKKTMFWSRVFAHLAEAGETHSKKPNKQTNKF